MCRCCPGRNRGQGKYTWEVLNLDGSVRWQKVTTPVDAVFNSDGVPNKYYGHPKRLFSLIGGDARLNSLQSRGVLLATGHAVFVEGDYYQNTLLLTSRDVTDGSLVAQVEDFDEAIVGRIGLNRFVTLKVITDPYYSTLNYQYKIYDGELNVIWESDLQLISDGITYATTYSYYISPFVAVMSITFGDRLLFVDDTGTEIAEHVTFPDLDIFGNPVLAGAVRVEEISRDGMYALMGGQWRVISDGSLMSAFPVGGETIAPWSVYGFGASLTGPTQFRMRKASYYTHWTGQTLVSDVAWETAIQSLDFSGSGRNTRVTSVIPGPDDYWWVINSDEVQSWYQDALIWSEPLTIDHRRRSTSALVMRLGSSLSSRAVYTPAADVLWLVEREDSQTSTRCLFIADGTVQFEGWVSLYDSLELFGDATHNYVDATEDAILGLGYQSNASQWNYS